LPFALTSCVIVIVLALPRITQQFTLHQHPRTVVTVTVLHCIAREKIVREYVKREMKNMWGQHPFLYVYGNQNVEKYIKGKIMCGGNHSIAYE